MLVFSNKILWIIAILIMMFTALYYSFLLGFPQLKIVNVFKAIFNKEDNMSGFFISLAAKLGVGTLAGTSLAIFLGGPGTIFWIWIFTFIISIINYIEGILSTIYKEKDNTKNDYGGPFLYIKKGLNSSFFSKLYSLLIILGYCLGFLGIQNNTMVSMIYTSYNINPIIISLIITIASIIVFFLGIKFILRCCNILVPIMSTIYIIIGLIAIIISFNKIPSFFQLIISDAFGSKSLITGGGYSILIALQRSIFATETGIGTSGMASCIGDGVDAKRQGYLQLLGVYIINFVFITITAFVVLTSPNSISIFNSINGIEVTAFAFSSYFGNFGNIVLISSLVLFGFSTIISGYYYSEKCLRFLIKTNKKWPYIFFKLAVGLCLLIFGVAKSSSIWLLVDISVALLSIINVLSILKLKQIVVKNSN